MPSKLGGVGFSAKFVTFQRAIADVIAETVDKSHKTVARTKAAIPYVCV
jgi:hypothetical protein